MNPVEDYHVIETDSVMQKCLVIDAAGLAFSSLAPVEATRFHFCGATLGEQAHSQVEQAHSHPFAGASTMVCKTNAVFAVAPALLTLSNFYTIMIINKFSPIRNGFFTSFSIVSVFKWIL